MNHIQSPAPANADALMEQEIQSAGANVAPRVSDTDD